MFQRLSNSSETLKVVPSRFHPAIQSKTFTWVLLGMIAIKVFLILARGPMELERDAGEYWDLSSAVLQGDLWLQSEPIAYRTPGYPWFLAVIRAISGHYALPTVVVVQGCLLVAISWLAGSLSAIMSRRSAARNLTLLVSLGAVSTVAFGQAVLSEVLFTFLLMLHLHQQALYAEHRRLRHAMGSAMALALCILPRPIAMLLWVIDLYWPIRSERKHFIHWAWMGLMVAAILLPWVIRNATIFGRPMLTQFMGRNLWVVTFQDQAGAGLELPGQPRFQNFRDTIADVIPEGDWKKTWQVSHALVASGLNDAEADRAMFDVALAAISNAPWQWSDKAFRRIVNFWRCVSTILPSPTNDPHLLAGEIRWHYSNRIIEWLLENRLTLSVTVNTLAAVLTWLAILWLAWCHSTRSWGLWSGLILFYFAVITGLFEIPDYRYRTVVEPLMGAVIAAALATLLQLKVDSNQSVSLVHLEDRDG